MKVVQLSVCIVACALKSAWCALSFKGTDLEPGERLLVLKLDSQSGAACIQCMSCLLTEVWTVHNHTVCLSAYSGQ